MTTARFPWAVSLTGAALVLLALATVAIRADVLVAGQELMRSHARHEALARRLVELRLDVDRIWQQGGEPAGGGRRAVPGAARP